MTIDEAIEILIGVSTYTSWLRPSKRLEAINLGIEALKLIQRERLLGINPIETRLLGETEE